MTPDRKTNPDNNDGWEEKEKADNLVDNANNNYKSILKREEMYRGFAGGMIQYWKDLDFSEQVLIRCERIKKRVYNHYK